MGFFDEHKTQKNELSDIIMWHHLLEPALVLLKDGSMMSVFKYRGSDLDSSTPNELVQIMQQVNNIIKGLDSGWVTYIEAQRKKSRQYPIRNFPDPVSQAIEDERRESMNSGCYYESEYFISLIFLPPRDSRKKISDIFFTKSNKMRTSIKDIFIKHKEQFYTQINSVFNLLADILPSLEVLKDGELLTYLHSCVSEYTDVQIASPQIYNHVPLYIDYILTDTPFLGGTEPKLGKKFVKVISIKAFTPHTIPCYLDRLNRLDMEYRWCNRMIHIDKQDAISELETQRKMFFAGRYSLASYIREIATGGQDSGLENTSSELKHQEAIQNIEVVSLDAASEVYFTMNVVLWDENPEELDEKAKVVIKTIQGLGFSVYDETINSLDAWVGSLPGHVAYNPRRPLYYSMGLTHLLPLSSVWAGPQYNNHLGSYPLMYTETSGSTPFRLDLHFGDVGHTLIVGPTGAGKSTHLGMLAAQWRSYDNAQVYFFDKDASSRILTLGVGGDFYDIGNENEALSFQPLARIDRESELIWAQEWLITILETSGFENGKVSPDTKSTLRKALKTLAEAPKNQRTLSVLSMLIQDQKIKSALKDYTVDGTYGKILDSNHDNLSYGKWQVFEMGKIMEMKGVCAHVLSYLFHRLETDRLDGSPTLFILDECWRFLQDEQFSKQIAMWLRTFRKKNACVVFATQSMADIVKSPILPTIQENCYTKIFLPNPNATDERNSKIYESFGLNSTEISIIAKATPKREYYFKNPVGSRLYNLNLGKVALAWVGSSRKEDQSLADEILNRRGKDFPYWWYQSKGLRNEALQYIKMVKNLK